MRIATWNVNSLKVRMPRVEEWLDYARPEIACLQETKLSDANFPHMAFSALGYESVHQVGVAHVAVPELEARTRLDAFWQAVEFAGVRQRVEHEEPVVGIPIEQVIDEVAPDESSSAGDQDRLRGHKCTTASSSWIR